LASDSGMLKKGKDQNKEPMKPLPHTGPVAVDQSGSITIAVHGKPGSNQNMGRKVGW
uniref:Uncharacterized protein n=1 Tax=Vombatus ursinus TaxID=29139 RepID=A0A4X2L4H5_VOMUR